MDFADTYGSTNQENSQYISMYPNNIPIYPLLTLYFQLVNYVTTDLFAYVQEILVVDLVPGDVRLSAREGNFDMALGKTQRVSRMP